MPRPGRDASAGTAPADDHCTREGMRGLLGLAASAGATFMKASTIVWERTAPLAELERRYLERALDWMTNPRSEPWLGARLAECQRLFVLDQPDSLLDDPNPHVVLLATAVILTV